MADAKERKKANAIEILKSLGFRPRQSNDVAAHTLLALLDLKPGSSWSRSTNPLRGITPIIEFIRESYGVSYAPNTRKTIRDEAVKHFVDAGLLLRNPDEPMRQTNSGKTVYQIEPTALDLLQSFGTTQWSVRLLRYEASRGEIRRDLERFRNMNRIPVRLSSGEELSLSPGGQNPLIKHILEEFCSRFVHHAKVAYIGDAERKFLYLDTDYLLTLGVTVEAAAKMPYVVLHDTTRNWLLCVEAVTSAGPVDGKRRRELKELFRGSTAGLVFVTAFSTREAMRSFLTQISWETEVWVADSPDHLIHFNGERFLGPYPDVMPRTTDGTL